MVILDRQKAFDTVNHKILISKLRAMGVGQAALKWFDSYLGGREKTVEISGVFSEFRTVTCAGCMLNGRPVARGECISSRASGTPVTTSPAGE